MSASLFYPDGLDQEIEGRVSNGLTLLWEALQFWHKRKNTEYTWWLAKQKWANLVYTQKISLEKHANRRTQVWIVHNEDDNEIIGDPFFAFDIVDFVKIPIKRRWSI